MNNKDPSIKLMSVNLLLPLEGFDNRLFSFQNLKKLIKLNNSKIEQNVGGEITLIKNTQYVKCIENLNLEVNKGEKLGIIGHNGSGKTTLLKIIAGIYPVGSGVVKVTGKISSFIAQGVGMNPEMNAFEYLKMDSVIKGLGDKESDKYIEEIIDFIELNEFSYAPLRTYSSGMLARLFSSASIFFPAEILLIDEGIGAGDRSFFDKFQKKLDEFIKKSNILVFTSHNKGLLKKWCNRGIVLKRGKIAFEGSIDECYQFYES